MFRSPIDDTEPPTAEYYREKAEEVRHFARRCRSHEIGVELFQLADRFDRMAAHVERRYPKPVV
jgi:hypothetical protein